MQELNCDELSYLTYVKKYIDELNITSKYKKSLVLCVEKLFDSNQLTKKIDIDEINRKMIAAEKDLVFTRVYANENDTLFACPHIIEDDILRHFRAFVFSKLK